MESMGGFTTQYTFMHAAKGVLLPLRGEDGGMGEEYIDFTELDDRLDSASGALLSCLCSPVCIPTCDQE